MVELVKQNFNENKKIYKNVEKQLRKELKETIPIEHVGSTAIKNMCGKNIIDIKNKIRKITFNNKIIFEGKIDYLIGFKLVFDENNNICEISYFK